MPESFAELLAGYYNRVVASVSNFKLQRVLTHAYEDKVFKAHCDGASKDDRVRILSKSSRATTTLLTTIPTEPGLCIPDQRFRTIVNFQHDAKRLTPGPCRCGARNPHGTVHHALGCRKYRGLWLRHDAVTSVVAQLCADVGLPVQTELIVGEGQRRIDFQTRIKGRTIYADVSCTHPLGATNLKHGRIASVAGLSASKRAALKVNSWKPLALQASATVVPLAFETYGYLCKEFQLFLRDLADVACEGVPALRTARHRQAWLQHAIALVAVTIQLGNAQILEDAAAPQYPRKATYPGVRVARVRGAGISSKIMQWSR
jgi:hypothetical protein